MITKRHRDPSEEHGYGARRGGVGTNTRQPQTSQRPCLTRRTCIFGALSCPCLCYIKTVDINPSPGRLPGPKHLESPPKEEITLSCAPQRTVHSLKSQISYSFSSTPVALTVQWLSSHTRTCSEPQAEGSILGVVNTPNVFFLTICVCFLFVVPSILSTSLPLAAKVRRTNRGHTGAFLYFSMFTMCGPGWSVHLIPRRRVASKVDGTHTHTPSTYGGACLCFALVFTVNQGACSRPFQLVDFRLGFVHSYEYSLDRIAFHALVTIL